MVESLRVCILSQDFIPVWSGIGSYIVELLRNIPSEVEVHLVTLRRKIRSQAKMVMVNDEVISKNFNNNLTIHYVSSAEDTFLYNLKFQAACLKFVPKLQKEHRLDLIHSNFPLMPDIFVKLFMKISVPTVSTIHTTIEGQHAGVKKSNMSLLSLERSDKANLLLHVPLRICELLYLKRVDSYIAPSKCAKAEAVEYLKLNKKKIHIIYHGVDTERFSPLRKSADEDSSPIVLFSGRLVSTKGVDTVIRAIPFVVRIHPETKFVFVGGGNFSPYARILESKAVSRRNYEFLGYVTDDELPQVYGQATIYVAPSLYETLGIRILEAMSCEKPVIASNIGGIPEAITSSYNGILIPPKNSLSLAKEIVRLLDDEELRLKLGKHARETILTKFSAKRMAANTVDYYRKLIN